MNQIEIIVPDGFNWIAQDYLSDWYFFIDKPKLVGKIWVSGNEFIVAKRTEENFTINPNYKTTLYQVKPGEILYFDSDE